MAYRPIETVDAVAEAWQALAGHGVQDIPCVDTLVSRIAEVEAGMEEVCVAVARVASNSAMPPLHRIRSLRAKQSGGHKSLYECLNQLTHYWYCCVAARHLFSLGCSNVRIRPTGADSHSKEGDAFDVVAEHPSGAKVVAEVFCVAPSLWQKKSTSTLRKLVAWRGDALRVVYYNLECKPKYTTLSPGIRFFGITADGEVQLVCSTEARAM